MGEVIGNEKVLLSVVTFSPICLPLCHPSLTNITGPLPPAAAPALLSVSLINFYLHPILKFANLLTLPNI